ncbi:glutathione peroxidase 7-like [Tubulanus polymorphus]|uniref:glutathione peroxidase 7-like n=1 Tax=Tubulanus polymorphus TaxID=672921 RepID=UPI003DA45FD9
MAAPMEHIGASKSMMYFLVFSVILSIFDVTVVFGNGDERLRPDVDPTSNHVNIYSFEVSDIDGNFISLDRFRGKVLLMVNVASECGFTDGHYKALVDLQRTLGKTGSFSVLGFPCNQFGAQEPGTNEQIKKFAQINYKVNFPMFAKINVVDGITVAPLWKYLAEKSGSAPQWNFWKYLVSSDGEVLQAWGPWNDWNTEIIPVIKAEIEKDHVKHNPDEL